MKSITTEQINVFHKKIISNTGGSEGIRDISIIDSALNRAFATFDGNDLYESDLKKISVISYGLISNHGFVDGNKRIGVATMLLFLKLNDINIKYTQKELVDLGLALAQGKYRESDIEEWIKRHQII